MRLSYHRTQLKTNQTLAFNNKIISGMAECDLQRVFYHDHTVIWKVFWELKVKKSGHAEKLELVSNSNSMKNPSQVIPISYFIIICIYFSSVLYAGSPCLMRISLVNFITAIFVSGFNVKFWSFLYLKVFWNLTFEDDSTIFHLYWSKDTHTSTPFFSYFSWTSSEIHKQISFI